MHPPFKKEVEPALDAERSFAMRLMEYLVVPTFVLDAHCRVLM
jgi:hypothetical protein